jgi:hypothetical protein
MIINIFVENNSCNNVAYVFIGRQQQGKGVSVDARSKQYILFRPPAARKEGKKKKQQK